MEVTVRHRDWEAPKTLGVDAGATVQALLDEHGFRAHAVLVLKGGEPVPENAELEEGADYEIIEVASGG